MTRSPVSRIGRTRYGRAMPNPADSHSSSRPAASTEIVRRNMQRQKRRDTGCEMAVRRLLHAEGIRYRVDFKPLSDERFRADIGWKTRRIAVFIDGCFWHACPQHCTMPKRNTEWWEAKLRANSARDQRADAVLRSRGWAVLRFWEHEPPHEVAAAIRTHLMRRAS